MTEKRKIIVPGLDYSVILEPQAEGGFTALVPALPEVVTGGETEEEALLMAEDAIRLALEYRYERGFPFPHDAEPLVKKVSIPAIV